MSLLLLYSLSCLVPVVAVRSSAAASSHRPVSLGLPVAFMKKFSEQIFQTAELYSQARLKLQNLTELTSDELREVQSGYEC